MWGKKGLLRLVKCFGLRQFSDDEGEQKCPCISSYCKLYEKLLTCVICEKLAAPSLVSLLSTKIFCVQAFWTLISKNIQGNKIIYCSTSKQ